MSEKTGEVSSAVAGNLLFMGKTINVASSSHFVQERAEEWRNVMADIYSAKCIRTKVCSWKDEKWSQRQMTDEEPRRRAEADFAAGTTTERINEAPVCLQLQETARCNEVLHKLRQICKMSPVFLAEMMHLKVIVHKKHWLLIKCWEGAQRSTFILNLEIWLSEPSIILPVLHLCCSGLSQCTQSENHEDTQGKLHSPFDLNMHVFVL